MSELAFRSILDLSNSYRDGDISPVAVVESCLNRVEKFDTVLLDFSGVDQIGQAFSDEIFRVFTRRNPHIKIHTVNTSVEIDKMILAAKSNNN